MATQHFAPLPAPEADRDGLAWIAPGVATAALGVLGPAALVFGGLSAMATDACGPDDCSQSLETSLALIDGTLSYGGFATLAAWLTAWLLPWRRRWSRLRASLAAASVLPPLFVLLLVFSLPAG
ncbi:hypothetical protein AB0E88_18460 [Streptomyces sp. NPDC028635]|uniref:hypothetical protein n=1 Tax=Streptomyces sp. NPDC028635 TaxID=3154800 RepID=UPI003411ECB8